eukprot:6196938-Pleurochrysis_carterae.AAC.1
MPWLHAAKHAACRRGSERASKLAAPDRIVRGREGGCRSHHLARAAADSQLLAVGAERQRRRLRVHARTHERPALCAMPTGSERRPMGLQRARSTSAEVTVRVRVARASACASARGWLSVRVRARAFGRHGV